jgi:glycogen(starch) synthase
MKILVLTNLYPPHYEGGYELHCQTVVNALQARGHHVDVLTSDHGTEQGKSSPEKGIARELKVHGLFGHPWLGIHDLAEQEKQNNRALQSALRRVKPDLVYIWSMSGLSKSLLFLLQDLEIPRVFAVCDHWIARAEKADVWLRWWNEKKVPFAKRLLRLSWSLSGYRRRLHKLAPTRPAHQLRFPRIYFCSRSLLNFTEAAGYRVGHGGVIYCPLDMERFKSTPRPASAPLERLLYVGRLTEDKGIMTALRAMAFLRDKFSGNLSIYGRGEAEYEIALKTYVQKEKLPVTFHNLLISEEIPNAYAAHDALLFTSEWPEPFALTPLEAMASGRPVIGTMTGGSPELFRHGQNALTYKAGDAEELARRVLELTADDTLRANISKMGYDEVRVRFAEPVILNQIEDYLQETLDCWQKFSWRGANG